MNVVPRAAICKTQNTIIEIRNAGSSATSNTGQKAKAFFVSKA